MDALGPYMEEELEFCEGSVFPQGDFAFLGAVLLDSVFYPLYEYMDIFLTTNLNYDFLINPIDYLNQTAQMLGLLDLLHRRRRQNNILGNPFVNSRDCAQLLSLLSPLDENETRTPKKRLSEAIAALRRNRGFYVFLQNISSIIDIISKNISNKSTTRKIKSLFLVYVVEKKIKLVNYFFLKTKRFSHYLYTDLYLANNKDAVNNPFQMNTFTLSNQIKLLCKKSAKHILTHYNEVKDANSFVIQILDSISNLKYINAFVNNNEFITSFNIFQNSFQKTYLQVEENTTPFKGNENMFIDLAKIFFNLDPEYDFTSDNKIFQIYRKKYLFLYFFKIIYRHIKNQNQ